MGLGKTLSTNADLRAGLPALLAGLVSLLVLILGVVLATRGRLAGRYLLREQRVMSAYDAALESDVDLNSLSALADELDIVNARLVEFEGGKAEQYWKWATFLSRHAAVVSSKSNGLSDEDRRGVLEQASKFKSDSQKLYAGLASGDSEYAARALEKVAEFQLVEMLTGHARAEQSDVSRLKEVLTVGADGEKEVGAPPPTLSLRWLLVAHNLELAWNGPSRLHYSRAELDEAALVAQSRGDMQLGGFVGILNSFGAKLNSERADDGVVGDSSGWKERLSQLLQQCVDGEWNDVAFLLARKNSDNGEAVRLGTARWICRLAVSEKAKRDAEWRSNYASGLQIVLQIAPQIPELAELVWVMAEHHASASVAEASESDETASQPGDLSGSVDMADGSQVVVPPEMVDAVIGGRAVAVRHMVLAFSSMLNGKMDVARSHLQLTQRSSGTLMQVSHIALGRLRSGAASDADVARLVQLMEAVVQLEPASGLNWFVLGVAQQRQGGLAAAETSLAKADELLPDTGAIKELLESVRSDRKRKERESQLRPVE